MELGDVTKNSTKNDPSFGATQWRFIEYKVIYSTPSACITRSIAAITVATACVIPNTVAASLAHLPDGDIYKIEHPSGCSKVRLEFDDNGVIGRTGIIRTARKLMDGAVYS